MSTAIEDNGMVSLGVERQKKKNCQARILHIVTIFFRNDGRRNDDKCTGKDREGSA